MNNECGNAHTVSITGKRHYCNLDRGHDGNHAEMEWSWPGMKAVATWPPACLEVWQGFTCTLDKGHSRDHEAKAPNGMVYGTWAQEPKPLKIEFIRPAEAYPVTHSVQFSTHELAELYSILAANHEIPEVYLNKVGKALKAAL